MPTILFLNGYRFFFYSDEGTEPAHIHVTKGDAGGKIWLEPELEVVFFVNFTKREQREIMEIVKINYFVFKNKWHDYFKK